MFLISSQRPSQIKFLGSLLTKAKLPVKFILMGSLIVFRICTCISIFNIIKHLFHVRFWPHCDKIVSIRFRVGKRRTFSKLNNDNANILHTFAKYYEYKLVHRLQTLNTTQQDTQLKALNSFGQHVARLKWKLYVALIKKVKTHRMYISDPGHLFEGFANANTKLTFFLWSFVVFLLLLS